MSIYLPIAEMPVNAWLVILTSGLIGFLSGLVGVGGGFIMTPALMLMGIPPAVAVSTQAAQITATSLSGVIAYARRRAYDLRMGLILAAAGVAGSTIGVQVLALFRALGQVDLLITVFYVFFLGGIGALMLLESLNAIRRRLRGLPPAPRAKKRGWAHKLPVRMRFPRSGLYISIIPPLLIGALTGLLVAIMGVGGGFLMVPAMIYLLRMPANLVAGTSLFSILFMTVHTTILHAVNNKTVDLVLAALLIVGGVVGAQLGARAGGRLRAEELRAILGIVVFGTALKLLYDLIATPREVFVLA